MMVLSFEVNKKMWEILREKAKKLDIKTDKDLFNIAMTAIETIFDYKNEGKKLPDFKNIRLSVD